MVNGYILFFLLRLHLLQLRLLVQPNPLPLLLLLLILFLFLIQIFFYCYILFPLLVLHLFLLPLLPITFILNYYSLLFLASVSTYTMVKMLSQYKCYEAYEAVWILTQHIWDQQLQSNIFWLNPSILDACCMKFQGLWDWIIWVLGKKLRLKGL